MFSKEAVCLVIAMTFAGKTSAADSKAVAPAPTTRSIMQSIFAPMTVVLSYSFDQSSFSESKNKDALNREIAKLARNIDQLAVHGRGKDRAFEYVAKSLARDARTLQRRFAEGNHDEARFVLHNMTENCMACHSNLPETSKFPGADQFFASVDVERLAPIERAHFQIISRRFDDALSTYEAFLKAGELDPWILTTLGAFSDYMKVSISVKSDFKKPQAVIEHWLKRESTPLHVKQQLGRWLAALKEFDSKNILGATDLAAARKVVHGGRALMEFPRDRDGLVHYLTAEAMLTRFVQGHADRGREVAEAYYLLGVASSMTEHSFWIVRSDFYLESAIRLDPAAAFAPKAYAALEESLVVAHSGSGGTHVPGDVAQLLSELKRLVEQEHGKI